MANNNPNPEWVWSEEHRDYYYARYNADGSYDYIWHKQQQRSPQESQQYQVAQHGHHGQPVLTNPAYQEEHQLHQQAYQQPNHVYHQQPQNQAYQNLNFSQWHFPNHQMPQNTAMQQYSQRPHQHYQAPYEHSHHASYRSRSDSHIDMPPPVPNHIRRQITGLMPGTPERGWEDELDSSYSMREGREAHLFFKIGRVFSMLWAESASATMSSKATDVSDVTIGQFQRSQPDILPGRFGELVYSQIRRFVIVDVKKTKHFVKACPIFTYTKRGTTKRGCDPKEHAIVYISGTTPYYLPGETGMTKNPIEIIPSSTDTVMEPESRIRFGKTHPIEWNVKIKDIGTVHPEHLSSLIAYWREEDQTPDRDSFGGEGDFA